MQIKRYHIIILICFLPILSKAQWGGKHAYSFLSVPTSPRSASLGGSAIAIDDNDLSLAIENPALLNPTMLNKMSVAYNNHVSDINFCQLAYSTKFNKIGQLAFGLQYMNAGKFIHADEVGNKYENFSANEFAFNIAYVKQLDSNLFIGVTVKPVVSQLYNYLSLGIAMDAGIVYTTSNKLTSAALVLKNMGSQIITYQGNYESLPFDIQLGVSTRLSHAPFRISVVAHSLNRLKMMHENTNEIEKDGIEKEPFKTSFGEHLLRHFIFGVEFLPVKSFSIRAGWNYQQRQVMKIKERSGIVGLSAGFGFKIKRFNINYSISRYHLASNSHQFSISTNLSNFIKTTTNEYD